MGIARGALAVLIALTGLAKLVGGYGDGFLPQSLYYPVAVSELVLAASLVTPWFRMGAGVVLVGALIGGGLSLLTRQHCGCLGPQIRMAWHYQMAMQLFVAGCASWVLSSQRRGGGGCVDRLDAGAGTGSVKHNL